MSKSIVGIAKSTSQVETTLADLQNNNLVPASDISLLMPDSGQDSGDTPELGAVKATKAPEGATTGAVSGGAVGATVGLLAGIGALAIPGLGPFIAAGPIMAALSGAAAGATAGGVLGGLVGLGIPEYEAKAYEDRIKKVASRCREWVSAYDFILREGRGARRRIRTRASLPGLVKPGLGEQHWSDDTGSIVYGGLATRSGMESNRMSI